MVIYIVSDGKKGHLSQTRGLADALCRHARELAPQKDCCIHEVDISGKSLISKLFYRGSDLDLPRPDLILCAGHGTHFPALSLARYFRCLCMVCMKPSLPMGMFDLCIVPRHDLPDGEISGGHIFRTIGAINSIRPRPDVEKREILILIGGPSKEYGWDAEMILTQLGTIARNSTSPMVLTTSRRTPPDFAQDVAAVCPSIRVEPVESTGPTWVVDHLASAREVWVTQDSVSMVYEALSSGAPVGILDMPRKGKPQEAPCSRVARGLRMLVDDGSVCTFTNWARTHALPRAATLLQEADRAADYILSRFPSLLS